jgi:hypothetical protein
MLFSHTKSQMKDEVERIKGRESNITSCFKKDKLKRLNISQRANLCITPSYNLTVSIMKTNKDPFELKFVKNIIQYTTCIKWNPLLVMSCYSLVWNQKWKYKLKGSKEESPISLAISKRIN